MIRDTYFKVGKGLISGIDPEKEYHNEIFVNCTFHPNCKDIIFDNCEFIECDIPCGMDYLLH